MEETINFQGFIQNVLHGHVRIMRPMIELARCVKLSFIRKHLPQSDRYRVRLHVADQLPLLMGGVTTDRLGCYLHEHARNAGVHPFDQLAVKSGVENMISVRIPDMSVKRTGTRFKAGLRCRHRFVYFYR